MADLSALLNNNAGTPALAIPPVDPRPPLSVAERMGLSHVDPEPYTAPAPPPLEATVDPRPQHETQAPVRVAAAVLGTLDCDAGVLIRNGQRLTLRATDAVMVRRLALRLIAADDLARHRALAASVGLTTRRRRGAAVPESVGAAVPLETSPAPPPPTRRRRRQSHSPTP